MTALSAEGLLDVIVTTSRSRLPLGVSPVYFDAFIARNRPALQAVVRQALAVVEARRRTTPVRLRPSGDHPTRSLERAVAKLLERVGVHKAIATGDHVKVENSPYQDLVLEWVITPHLSDWHYPGATPALGTMLSMAHYIDHESGDRYADLEVVFRVEAGLITDHRFIVVGGRDVAGTADATFLRTWLRNIKAQGFKLQTPTRLPARKGPLAEPKTKKQRTDANVAAMNLAASKAPSAMSPSDLETLALYSGWGGLSIRAAAHRFPADFPHPEPRGLIHEYYTPSKVTSEVVRVLKPLLRSVRNDDGRILALEPSAGIGRFVNAARGLAKVRWKVVEYSALSSRMLAAMRPDLEVFSGSFERWVAENEAELGGRVNLILSNPPYGKRGASIVEDPARRYREKAAYAYFLRRGLDLLAEGGIGVFLVPAGFLTGPSNRALREKVLRSHHLMSAFRLPSGLFPGAELVTDLLFFRSRGGRLDEVAAEDRSIVDGHYFAAFPDHILGQESGKDGGGDDQTRKPRWGYQVVGEFTTLPDLVERPMCSNCSVTRRPRKPARAPKQRQAMTRTDEESAVAIAQLDEHHRDAVLLGDRVDRYLAEVGRDSARALKLWKDLKDALEAWAHAHGNPHGHHVLRRLAKRQGVTGAQRMLAAFASDGTLATAMSKRPVVRSRYTGAPDDVKAQAAALYISQHSLKVSELLRFHRAQGGKLSNATQVVSRLVRDGSWAVDWTGRDADLMPTAEYLAGWLWDRYDRAVGKARGAGSVAQLAEKQASALLSAIRPVVYDEIDDVSPQQTWVPLELLQGWLNDKLGLELDLGRCEGLVCVSGKDYDQMDGRGFSVDGTYVDPELEWVLGWINHDKTLFSPRKIGALRDEHLDQTRLFYAAKWTDEFQAWAAAETERQELIASSYNRRFRGFVPPKYSDAKLEIARWDWSRIRPHAYQNESVRRLEAHRGGLLAYDVGLGKTYTGLALLARARQEGWSRRPVILVPNSIVWKWHADIERVLPDFRVGVVGSRLRRKQLPPIEAELAMPLSEALVAFKSKHPRGRKGAALLQALAEGVTTTEALEMRFKGVPKALEQLEAAGVVRLTRPPDFITSVNDTPEQRAATWTKLQTGQLDVVLLTYTALARTRMNEDAVVEYAEATESIKRTIALSRRNAKNTKAERLSERQEAILAEGVRAWVAEQMEIPEGWDYDPGIAWDDIGIDLLICDEAQNFKNLYLPEAREGGVPRFMGNSGSGSKRAWQLDFRLGAVRRNANGAGVVLLSATPAKNSPLEFYNLLQYVDHDVWTRMGIHNPEAFIDRYCQIEMRMVLNSKMAAEQKSACVGFKNLHELRDALFRFGEFKTADQVGLVLPEPKVRLERVDMNAAQEAKYEDYVEKVKKALKAPPKSKERGQVLGLLARMSLVAIHQALDEGYDWKTAATSSVTPHSPKFDKLAQNVMRDRRQKPGCGHIIFVDNVAAHRWVVEVLVKAGMPRDRIAVLNAKTAKAAAKRQQIAQAFNGDPDAGVKPLYDAVIANAIAYEGIDLQTRTCAIHHLDLPWEPATLQQRNGRGHRQGNRNSSIGLYYYFANRSQDGQRFQLIQGKRGWMTALIESQDRATNNPGAALDMGPEETLLLVSRDPEETAKLIEELAVKRQAAAKDKALKAAARHMKVLNSLLRRIESADEPGERNKLRADARDRLEALEAIDDEAWAWKTIALAQVKRHAVAVTVDAVPLWEGQRLTYNGVPIEIGSLAGAVHYRMHGGASWTDIKLSEKAADKAPPDGLNPAWDEDADWRGVNRSIDYAIRSLSYGEFNSTLGLDHASDAWRAEVWSLHAHAFIKQLSNASYSYWLDRQFVPNVANDRLDYVRGAALRSAQIPAPTNAGWAEFLALVQAGATELKVPEIRKVARYWWGRSVPNSALPTAQEAA